MKAKICYWAALVISLGTTVHVHAASTIQFTATSYTKAESAGTAILKVQRTSDTNTEVGVEYVTADGTATNGLKYIPVSGTLAFGVGETNKTIVVPILNEGFVEGTKTFQVFLSNPTVGAVLGARTNATVSITDNDFGIQFQFAAYSPGEDTNAVMIGVVRDDDGILPVTVDFFTTDLTAKSGLDYTGATNTLSFAPQERLKFISIPILNNTLKEPNRSFLVTLFNPTGATLGSQKTATVTIVDNDQGFQFASATYTIAEDAGVALIVVRRGTDDTNSTVNVEYATSDGSATNGVDYTGITNTLAFGPGERVKQVVVPILNNGIKQATRNLDLTLSNPTGGAVLGSPTTSRVSILDNDPGLGFERATYTNGWGQEGAFGVSVLRGNDWLPGLVTVDYKTANLSATAGSDYQAVSGTLEFHPNESVKTIEIPILRPRLGGKAFRVVLSNITGGATLGTSSTTVSILGSYATVAPPFDTALSIGRNGEFNILTWSGVGQLQRADKAAGPWQSLTSTKNPTTVQSSLPTTFYRVTLPEPTSVYVPSGYDGQTALPLVILLHGYTDNGDDAEGYTHLRPLAESKAFLYCHPDRGLDQSGKPFWNATDGCCDWFDTGRDDASYLRAVIEEIARHFAVDRKRIYLVGWSNGSFMAYRMACQFADLIAGIACRSGATFLDPRRCAPSQPVNVLHIHGTKDMVNFYDGGADTISGLNLPSNMSPFPGARQTVQFWAGYNGASDPVTESEPSLDIDLSVPGLDTVITRYTKYPPGGAVELWTINGATHFPMLSPEFAPRIIDWLLAHPKP